MEWSGAGGGQLDLSPASHGELWPPPLAGSRWFSMF